MLKLLAALVAALVLVAAQTEPGSDDATGTQYTVFFSENDAKKPPMTFDCSLFITTHEDRTLTVNVQVPLKSAEFPDQRVTVKKGEVTEVKFPQTIMHEGSSIASKGIRLLASGDIIVYGINPQRYSSEGFMALPDRLLGTEYYAISMPVTIQTDSAAQLGVVAVNPGTTVVNVTLPNPSGQTLKVFFGNEFYRNGAKITASLRQYQTLQLQHHISEGMGDLSGARIVCSQNCAAQSGNSRVAVEGGSRDLLVEQLPPVATWGKEFAVPTTPERSDRPDVLKIVCQQDNTAVTIDGDAKNCNTGGVLAVEVSAGNAHYVSASKPIMCSSVVKSQRNSAAEIKADPAMTLIIPEEQYAQSYTIATAEPTGGDAYKHYITVVIRRGRVDSIILDGENVNTAFPELVWKVVPGTNADGAEPLVTAFFIVTAGTHTIGTINDDATFMCIVYGAGDRETYAYMGGMRLAVINPPCTQTLQTSFGDGKDNDCDANIDEELCDATDDDGDGAIDEDCRVENAIIALGDQNIRVGEGTTLQWKCYAVDKNFDSLVVRKQQPGGEWIEFASGEGDLTLKEPFLGVGRYSFDVSQARKSGELWIVDITLNVANGAFADTGNYSLIYSGHDGQDYSDENYLKVRPVQQTYAIIASDIANGGDQTARSEEPRPRNFFFSEGSSYRMTFQSIGGQYVDDLPYRLFFDDEDVTSSFEVLGSRQMVSGATMGLQDVKTVYELVNNELPANIALNKQVVSAKSNDASVKVDAVMNVDALTRPKMTCEAQQVPNDANQAQIVCDISDVTVNLDLPAKWSIDDVENPMDTTLTSQNYGDYTVWLVNNNDGTMKAYIRGIRANQWPSSGGVRNFRFWFQQTNKYSLSANIPIDVSLIKPSGRGPTLEYSIDAVIGRINMHVLIKGANPNPTIYNWSVRNQNGVTIVNIPQNREVTDYKSSDVQVLRNGDLRLTLTTGDKPFSRTVVFTTSAVEGRSTLWDGTVTFDLPAASRTGSVAGRAENAQADGTLVMNTWVNEGSPASNTYKWRIQLADGSYVEANPGESGEGWSTTAVALDAQGRPSSTLTVNYFFTQQRKFKFTASSVNRETTNWSANYEFTYPSNRRQSNAGAVNGVANVDQTTGWITIRSWVVGGSPAADTYSWRIVRADGRSYTVSPNSQDFWYTAGPMTTNANGYRESVLTIKDNTADTREFRFTASNSRWNAFKRFTVPGNLVTTRPEVTLVKSGRNQLIATVTGGSPDSDSWIWTLPGGETLRAGQTSSDRAIRATDGEVRGNIRTYKLIFSDDYVDSELTYRFTTSAANPNGGSFWSLWREITVNHQAQRPTITSRHDFRDRKVFIYMTVRGGFPAATGSTWEFTVSGRQVRLIPGASQSQHTAYEPTTLSDGSVEYKLSVDELSVLPMTYTFTIMNRAGDIIQWSESQRYQIDAPSQEPVITARDEFSDGKFVIYMVVRGGSPAYTSSFWTYSVNGQDVEIRPGHNRDGHTASNPVTLSNGDVEWKLTINDLTMLPKNYMFTVASGDIWSKSQGYRVEPANPPTVTCSPPQPVTPGNEVEILCAVVLNDYPANSLEMSYNNGPNSVGDGYPRQGYTYNKRPTTYGVTTSLKFRLPATNAAGSTWVHRVSFAGGKVETPITIRLSGDGGTTATTAAPQPSSARQLAGVEGDNVVMTCRLPASQGVGLNVVVWERISLGPNSKVQTVYENNRVSRPFSSGNRFQVEKSTRSRMLSTILKINNLQRSDAAKFRCRWGTVVSANFNLDVIGTSLLVDGTPYNGLLTKFVNGQTYNIKFDFESAFINSYSIFHNSAPSTDQYVFTQSEQTRHDSYAQESYPVKVYSYADRDFMPTPFAIQSFYTMDGNRIPIKLYVLTKETPGTVETPEILEYEVNDESVGTSGPIRMSRQPVKVEHKFKVKTCDMDIRILIGDRDQTSEYRVNRDQRRDYCILTYTRVNYNPERDGGKSIKIINQRTNRREILSDRPIELVGPGSPVTPPVPATEAPIKVNECGPDNGGCDHSCTRRNGISQCGCPSGLRLSENAKSCIDIDECSQSTETCSISGEKCLNTYGSYQCFKLCECNCCEANDRGVGRGRYNSERTKREIGDLKRDQTEFGSTVFFPLSGAGVVSWLSVITAISVIALLTAVFAHCRRGPYKIVE